MDNLNQLKMQSPDLNAERLDTLKNLFPDLFTMEGRLNPDELKKLVDAEITETERFEFKWFGKNTAKRNAFTPSKATLLYDETRSVNPDAADGNMIIEGENLESLKCLLSGYREKIKCIYIDPPYNTGKDFVYSDKWDTSKDEYWEGIGVTSDGVKIDTNVDSSGRFHSNWLSMLYPRLLLARQLLSQDGVIFISIDDNEIYHLKKLCNEVFGEANFVTSISVLCNPKGRSQDKYFATNHEYVIAYTKNTLPKGTFSIAKEEDQIEAEYPEEDDVGKYRLIELRNTHREFGKHNRKNLYYPLFANADGEVSIKPEDENEKVLPDWDDGYKGCWTWDKKKATKDNALLVAQKVKGRWKIYRKSYANGVDRMLKTILMDKLFYTERGQKEFNALFNTKEKVFQSPKSPFLISQLIKTSTQGQDIVLDFFAGSGTSAHSVMQLNADDKGDRKFILVQMPELTEKHSEAYKAGFKKISDITIERNKRVIDQLEQADTEESSGLFGDGAEPFKTGFKVYKLAKSNFPRVEFAPDPEKTDEENIELLKQYIKDKEAAFRLVFDEHSVFDEVLLKNGFMLNYTKEKVAGFKKNTVFHVTDAYRECLICLDIPLKKESLKTLEQHKEKIFICLEQALDTTMKWNLKHLLGDKLIAF